MSNSDTTNKIAASVFTRIRLLQRSYVLAELASQHKLGQSRNLARTELAGYLRLGWYILESLDVYAEANLRYMPLANELNRFRYIVGSNWKILPWIELIPMLALENGRDTGTSITWMGQFHVIY